MFKGRHFEKQTIACFIVTSVSENQVSWKTIAPNENLFTEQMPDIYRAIINLATSLLF